MGTCVPAPGSLPLLGQCLTSYWEQKKLMAPGCEPRAVRRLMAVLAPHVHGQSLAGAGGGGFLYLLTKEPRQKEALEAVLAEAEVGTGVLLVPQLLGLPPQSNPLHAAYPLLPGPGELQRPPGASGHSGPEPAAAGE